MSKVLYLQSRFTGKRAALSRRDCRSDEEATSPDGEYTGKKAQVVYMPQAEQWLCGPPETSVPRGMWYVT